MCGDFVESKYYMPTSGTNGDRSETHDVCAICSSDTHIVNHEEMKTKKDSKG